MIHSVVFLSMIVVYQVWITVYLNEWVLKCEI